MIGLIIGDQKGLRLSLFTRIRRCYHGRSWGRRGRLPLYLIKRRDSDVCSNYGGDHLR